MALVRGFVWAPMKRKHRSVLKALFIAPLLARTGAQTVFVSPRLFEVLELYTEVMNLFKDVTN